ncbi:MAG: PaaI family thioesterase [Eubacteriales bacterium]|nr:PaaI family thioesterase [Eubacteriales bacterium]
MDMTESERQALINKTEDFIVNGRKPGYFHHLAEDLGAKLQDILPDGTVKIRYPVTDSQRNGVGNLQGGMMASLIDNAVAISIVPRTGPFMTIDLSINYFAPVTEEFDYVDLEVKTIKPGNTVKYIQIFVYRGDGKLAALAGTNVMHDKKH